MCLLFDTLVEEKGTLKEDICQGCQSIFLIMILIAVFAMWSEQLGSIQQILPIYYIDKNIIIY
jgi:hypothetical protein